MASLGLSGLASGVDTGGIVERLMALERQSLLRVRLSKSRITARDTGLKDVQSKLSALQSAAEALRSTGLWTQKQTAESSDPTRVSAEVTGGAGIGATSVQVLGLASSTQRTYAYTPSATGDTLSFTSAGSATKIDLAVPADATIDSVASMINGRSDLPVYAAVVALDPAQPDVKSLVLSSRVTGDAATSDFSMTGATVKQDVPSYKEGTNARYSLDGGKTVLESSTNVVENAIPGVKLTLKGLTTTDVTINVGVPSVDKEAVKAKVKAFVEAYNAMVNATRSKISEKRVQDPATNADALKGQLFGDSPLNRMLDTMRRGMSDIVAGNPAEFDALADLGISTGAIGAGMNAISGTLVIDDAKLATALDTDPLAVRKLLGGESGVDGFAQRVEALVKTQVGTTGEIDSRLKGSTEEQKRLNDLMTRTESRLAAREKRLKAQFAAMESAMQASQTQQAWLQGQLATLNFG
ncbi:MAG: flagellar filament capping protein FliD [Actinomycetota bacterium]|nr:flagellar filament capping protein FliD [Actinomycetota bacterium]